MNKKVISIFCGLILMFCACKSGGDANFSGSGIRESENNSHSSVNNALETKSQITYEQPFDLKDPVSVEINGETYVVEEYEAPLFNHLEPEYEFEKSGEYIQHIGEKIEEYIPSDYLYYEITTYLYGQVLTAENGKKYFEVTAAHNAEDRYISLLTFCVSCDDINDIYINDVGAGGIYVPFRAKVDVLDADELNIILDEVFLKELTVTDMAYFKDDLGTITVEGNIEFYANSYTNLLTFYNKDTKEYHKYYFYMQ